MPMYDRKSYKNPRLPRANEALGAGQRSPSAPPRAGGMLKMAAAARARQPKPGAPPIPETRPFNPKQRPSGAPPRPAVQQQPVAAGMTESDRRRRAAAIIAQDKQGAWDNLNAMTQGQGGQPTQYPTIPKPPDEETQMLKAQGGGPAGAPSPAEPATPEVDAGAGAKPAVPGAPGQQPGLYGDIDVGEEVPAGGYTGAGPEPEEEVPSSEVPGEEPPPVPPEGAHEPIIDPETGKEIGYINEKGEKIITGGVMEDAEPLYEAAPVDEEIIGTTPDPEGTIDAEGTTPAPEAEVDQFGEPIAGTTPDPDSDEYGYGHGDTEAALAQHQKYEKAFSDYLSQSTGIPEEELQGQIAQLQMASADQMAKFAQQMAARGMGASGLTGQGMGQIASQTVAAVANLRFENAKLAIDEKLNKMKAYMSMYGQMMSEQNRKDIFDEMSALEKDKFKYEKDQNALADEWTKLNNMAAMAQAYDDDAMSYAFNAMTELVHDTDGDGKPDAPMSASEVMANLYTYVDDETGIVRLGLKVGAGKEGESKKGSGGTLHAPMYKTGQKKGSQDWANAPENIKQGIYDAFEEEFGHKMSDKDGIAWTMKFAKWVQEKYSWKKVHYGD